MYAPGVGVSLAVVEQLGHEFRIGPKESLARQPAHRAEQPDDVSIVVARHLHDLSNLIVGGHVLLVPLLMNQRVWIQELADTEHNEPGQTHAVEVHSF